MAITQHVRIEHIKTKWNMAIEVTYADEAWEENPPVQQTGGTTLRVVTFDKGADIADLPAWMQATINAFWDDVGLTALYDAMIAAELDMQAKQATAEASGLLADQVIADAAVVVYNQSINNMKYGMMVDLTVNTKPTILRRNR